VRLFTGASRLVLPVRPPRPEDADLPAFPPAEVPQMLETSTLRPGHVKETVERDLVSGETIFTTDEDSGLVRLDHIGIDVDHQKLERFSIRDGDPLSARAEISHKHAIKRGDWHVRTETRTTMTATATEFLVNASLDAFEADKRVFSRKWALRHRRDMV